MRTQWITTVAVMVLTVSAIVQAAPGDNIALGRPYTWSTAPTYSLCTDPDDTIQLTDGVYIGALHTDIRCVGWKGSGTVSITIDLGEKKAISGIKFSAGYLPAFINLWVSDDNYLYTWGGPLTGGEIRAMAWQQQGKPTTSSHVFEVSGLELAGRYVKFSAYRATQYLFCDEIEVIEGDFAPATVTPSPISKSSGFEDPDKTDAVARVRMLYDLEDLQNHPQAGAFVSQLNTLESQAVNMIWVWSLVYENGLPYTNLHRDIWKLNGPMNQADGFPEFSLAPGQLYELLSPFDTFTAGPQVVHMLGGEKRSAAVNVQNFSTDTTTFDVQLNWQDDGFSAGDVYLKTVRFTEAQRRWICSYALPKATKLGDNHWQVSLPAGVTSQLWLTFNSENVWAGDYEGQLVVTPQGHSPVTQPLQVQVHAGRRLESYATMDNSAFDYVHLPARDLITQNNIGPILSVMHENNIYSHWIDRSAFAPTGGIRYPDGTYATLPVFDNFNAWLDDLAALPTLTRRYFVFLNLPVGQTPYAGTTVPGTPEYATAISCFFHAVANEITARGLSKSQFVFHPLDEPHGLAIDAVAADFINIAKAAEPEFLFMTNPAYKSLDAICHDLIDAVDILIPNLNILFTNSALVTYFQNVAAAQGKELGIYQCTDGGWLRSPIGYYRRMAWEAQRMGMSTIGVWTVSATDKTNTWDDFTAEDNYFMIFATSSSATSDKVLTAWRDGVEDFEYFKILEDLIARGPGLGIPSNLLTSAQNLVDTLPATAIANRSNTDAFDVARVQLLDMIDQLAAAATPTTCQEAWELGHGLAGDLDHDCRVDLDDFAQGAYTFSDLQPVIQDWLLCNDPTSDCL